VPELFWEIDGGNLCLNQLVWSMMWVEEFVVYGKEQHTAVRPNILIDAHQQ